MTAVDRDSAEFLEKVRQCRVIAENLITCKEDLKLIPYKFITIVNPPIEDMDELIAILDMLGIDACIPTDGPIRIRIRNRTYSLLKVVQEAELECGNPLRYDDDIIMFLLKSSCPFAFRCNRFAKVNRRFSSDDEESG